MGHKSPGECYYPFSRLCTKSYFWSSLHHWLGTSQAYISVRNANIVTDIVVLWQYLYKTLSITNNLMEVQHFNDGTNNTKLSHVFLVGWTWCDTQCNQSCQNLVKIFETSLKKNWKTISHSNERRILIANILK